MNGYVLDIEKSTLENTYYRRVLYTTKENQIVLMSIPPKIYHVRYIIILHNLLE